MPSAPLGTPGPPGKDIDLTPPQVLLARRRRLALLAGAAAVLLAAALAWLPYRYFNLVAAEYRARAAANASLIERLEGSRGALERLEAARAGYEALRSAVGEIDAQRKDLLKVVEEVAGALPPGMTVTRMTLDAQKVSLTVVVRDPVDAARALVYLRRLDILKGAELSGVALAPGPKEVSFELQFSEKGNQEVKKPAGELVKALKELEEKEGVGQSQ